MSDNVVQVKLEASYGEFQSSFAKAREFMAGVVDGMKAELKDMSDQAKVDSKAYESTMEQFGNIVQNRFKGINGAIAGVKTAWAQLGLVIGAGLAAGKAVDDAAKYGVEMQKLAKALGITTNSASVLALALGDVHSSSAEYLGAVKGLDNQVRLHEKSLNAMGLATRDSNGELRGQQDLMLDALKVLRGYKEGTDRNLASVQLFGRGVEVTSEMIALTSQTIEEAKEKASDLNLIWGTQSVEALEAYRKAMGDVGDIITGLKVTVGMALMPVLTEMASWFSGGGSSAVLVFRTAIATVVTAFEAVVLAVKVVWAVVNGAFSQMVTTVSAFSQVFTRAMTGDFAGAQAGVREFFSSYKQNAAETLDSIATAARKTGMALLETWVPLVNGEGQGKSGGKKEGKDRTDPEAEERARKAALAAARKAAAEEKKIRDDAFRDTMDRLKEELDGWKNNYDERLEIAKKMQAEALRVYGEKSAQYREASQRVVEIEKAAALQIRALHEQASEYERNRRYEDIEAARQAADFEVQLGAMTVQERLATERDFENQLFQLKQQELADKLALMELDPDRNPILLAKIKEEMYQVEADHAARIKALQNQSVLEARAPFHDMMETIKNGWAQTAASVLTRQMSVRDGLKALWKQSLSAFTKFLADKLVASKLFASLEIAVEKMIVGVLRALGLKSAADSIASKTSESGVKIGQSAAVAASGAAESQASIPYVGPILAIAAMAAMFAAVMAMKGGGGRSTPSAARGFDIPVGVNPLTQLHEREMVLPQSQADIIRGLADSGIGGAGGIAVHNHFSTPDPHAARRWLLENNGAVVESLKTAMRDFRR